MLTRMYSNVAKSTLQKAISDFFAEIYLTPYNLWLFGNGIAKMFT